MLLQEREDFLDKLHAVFKKLAGGEGHTVFISGEAGIGKTSLVREFANQVKSVSLVLTGTCDALFTPRPLGPVADVLLQLRPHESVSGEIGDRTAFFSHFFLEIETQVKPVIIVFEDVHWADEASIDFIKFFARRISQLRCMFILTFRDNETDARHPLSAITGQITPDSFSRLRLTPLSRKTVESLAGPKGFDGKEVFSISGGNPFYVNEILASYSSGVPEKVKDSILSVFNQQEPETREAWKLLSVLPQGLLLSYTGSLQASLVQAFENSLDTGILIIKDATIFFKHELYRRTIEVSLSPLLRISLNRKMLDLLREREPSGSAIEQIIHFAKNANEGETVVAYAPMAAKQAAELGSHREARRLYLSAIEYYQGTDTETLLRFYEGFAYESYLTNQITEAIIYSSKAHKLWKMSGNKVATGNALRFLSRLWWYGGNKRKAESYGLEAIGAFSQLPASPEKAMAFSNMSQLKMLADDVPGCLQWGNQAIEMAKEIGDNSTLSHALNNAGTSTMSVGTPDGRTQGERMLRQSLQIALDHGFHEHAARAYTNLGSNLLLAREYRLAAEALDTGVLFCEEKDLDAWIAYMSAMKARLCMETGRWNETLTISGQLLQNKSQAAVSKIVLLIARGTVKMRCGEPDGLLLLQEALAMAAETQERQRLIPALVALLEWEWIHDTQEIQPERLEECIQMAGSAHDLKQDELDFWLMFSRRTPMSSKPRYIGFSVSTADEISRAAEHWRISGNQYQRALCHFMGNEMEKRTALDLVLNAGAIAVAEKMKREMRVSGIRNIPRGLRKSTRENPLQLTVREIELLPLLREGLQNKEIAARLFISPKTVDHHISSIYSKLEVKTRAAAVQAAIRLRVI